MMVYGIEAFLTTYSNTKHVPAANFWYSPTTTTVGRCNAPKDVATQQERWVGRRLPSKHGCKHCNLCKCFRAMSTHNALRRDAVLVYRTPHTVPSAEYICVLDYIKECGACAMTNYNGHFFPNDFLTFYWQHASSGHWNKLTATSSVMKISVGSRSKAFGWPACQGAPELTGRRQRQTGSQTK